MRYIKSLMILTMKWMNEWIKKWVTGRTRWAKNYCWKIKIKTLRKKKTGRGSKILTPNKLLTRFPVLLAQMKAGNNSKSLKNEIRKILYILYQHNKITKKVYNNLIKSL